MKVVSSGEMRAETLRLADAFHAKVVDATSIISSSRSPASRRRSTSSSRP